MHYLYIKFICIYVSVYVYAHREDFSKEVIFEG